MATGIDIMIAAICLNLTTCDENIMNELNLTPPLSSSSSLPEQPSTIINENILLSTGLSTSMDEKFDFMTKLREQLNGQKLTIAYMEDYPLSYVQNNTGQPEGVAFQLLEFLTKKFNFTFDVIKPPKDIYGSSIDMDGSLLELLKTDKADMAAVFMPIMADARQHVEFSTTILDEGNWIMMMRRPSESATGSGLLAPFDRDVWLLILLSLLTVGPSIYGLIIIRMKLTKDKEQQIYPLPHCVWFVYGALMKQGSTLSPLADSTRLLFATWWIFITILTSFYTANLTAFLTLSQFTLPINSYKDILQKNQYFVSQRGGAVEYAIKNPNETLGELQKMVSNKRGVFTEINNQTYNLLYYVQQENYVLIKDRPSIDHLIYADYKYRKTISQNDRDHCPFAVSKTPFLTRKRSFAYKKNFLFRHIFDPELQHLVESGIIKYMLMENLPKAEICPQKLKGTERQLRNGDLLMTYQIMLAGFGTGTVIFVTEILFRFLLQRQDKSNVHPFRNKNQDSGLKSVTPPPSYATLFNQSRKNNIWTTHNFQSRDGGNILNGGPNGGTDTGVNKYINGRHYKVVKNANGEERLIPMRTPSAALFQYSYTN